jgi:hypothetical protein
VESEASNHRIYAIVSRATGMYSLKFCTCTYQLFICTILDNEFELLCCLPSISFLALYFVQLTFFFVELPKFM